MHFQESNQCHFMKVRMFESKLNGGHMLYFIMRLSVSLPIDGHLSRTALALNLRHASYTTLSIGSF